jgi:hypothetical protein
MIGLWPPNLLECCRNFISVWEFVWYNQLLKKALNQLLNKSSSFMKPDGSLSSSQTHTPLTELFPEPVESIPRSDTLFHYDHF